MSSGSEDSSPPMSHGDWRDWVRANHAKALGAARRHLSDPQDAEDAVQEGFFNAYCKVKAFPGDRPFLAWVLWFVKYASLNVCHKNGRQALLPPPDDPGDDANDIRAREKTAIEGLRILVEGLPSPFDRNLKSYYFDERSVKEIAKQERVCAGTIQWRLDRGRKLLRERVSIQDAPW